MSWLSAAANGVLWLGRLCWTFIRVYCIALFMIVATLTLIALVLQLVFGIQLVG